jgi:hypothetical protein
MYRMSVNHTHWLRLPLCAAVYSNDFLIYRCCIAAGSYGCFDLNKYFMSTIQELYQERGILPIRVSFFSL